MKLRKHQDLLWLEEMEKRGGLTLEGQRELKHKQAGFLGEHEFGAIMRQYLPKNWQLLQDIRLKTPSGEIQIDAILVNNLGLTVFEVKNYTADYHYKEGRWQVNGRLKYHDDFLQLERTVGLLSQLLKQNGFKLPIQNYVVYINEEDTVEIDDETLPYLKRAKLRRFIKEAIENCQIAPHQSYERLSNWLVSQHQADDRRLTLTEEEFAKIKKGIYCVNCASFDIEFQRYHAKCCSCHYTESREKAIVRTICDYGILFPYEDLTAIEVGRLIGPTICYSAIYQTLAKYFKRLPHSRKYCNGQLPLNELFSEISFRYNDKHSPNQVPRKSEHSED